MRLHDLLVLLRRRWLTVLLVAEATLLVALAWTSTQTPLYQSSARLFVANPGAPATASSPYQDSLFSQERAASYAALLAGPRVAQAVVDRLSLPYGARALQARVTARVVPETVLLHVTVTDPDPQQAQRLVGAVAAEFLALVPVIENGDGRERALVHVTVVEPPDLPTDPVQPRPLRTAAVALVLGVVAGAGLVVVLDELDTTVRTVEGLAALTGASVLSVVPHDRQTPQRPLVPDTPQSPRADSYRRLRTALHFAHGGDRPRSLVVTSATAGDGKSVLAANLALALAGAGDRVVLVDADLWRPSAAAHFDLGEGLGLTDVLTSRAALDEALGLAADGLAVLGPGPLPPDPVDLLGPRHLGPLLAELSQRWDRVVLSAPPLLPVADASVLAGQADGVLLVVRHGRTREAQVRQCLESLGRVQARLVGTVLSMAPPHALPAGTGYGYAAGRARAGTAGALRPLPRDRGAR